MGLLVVAFSLLVFVVGPSYSQQTEEIFNLPLKTILEGQTKILQKLEELQTKMASMEGKMAKLDELEVFQNMIVTKQEDLSSSVEKCSTRDQIITVLDRFETDECENMSHNCSTFATCQNTITSYKCSCNPGYSGDGFTCEDINECDAITNGCHRYAICTNTIGNYSCECPPTFDGDGYSCTDINECVSGAHQCHPYATCTNTIGSYTCTCDYSHYGDGYNCTDINECELSENPCPIHATCTNTIPSYTCQCDAPYCDDGHGCSECKFPSAEIKGLGNIVLVMKNVTWDNAQDACKEYTGGNGRLLEGIGKEHLPKLQAHFRKELHGWNPHVGIKGARWVKSGDEVSSSSSGGGRDIWMTGEPNGDKLAENDCGAVQMYDPVPKLYDTGCSQLRYSLCSVL